ncbi:MAG: hypothetical protein NPMRTH1_1390007 [Nitrosopumilales archaeon]|nr:MAG: hypothetical protein NPMRTH1_1390007 [Nitrosopumilales archaeon]
MGFRKYYFLIFLLVTILVSVSLVDEAFAPYHKQPQQLMSVSTDKLSYNFGDFLTINGQGAESYSISIIILSPSGEEITELSTFKTSAGEFSTIWIIPSGIEKGMYTIKASDSTQTAQTTFTLGNVEVKPLPDYDFTENDIQWCEEVYPQYDTLGLDWFLENYHYTIEARVCASLYEDSMWNYEGPDRIEKLLERTVYYIDLEISESKKEAETGLDDPTPASIRNETVIPYWIKNVAEFWMADQIDDSGFIQVIEYLVQQEIIKIPYAEAPQGEAAVEIPSWIKTTAEFWVTNEISDDEFAIGLEWLINNGIIRI